MKYAIIISICIVVLFIGSAGLIGCSTYNGLVSKNESVSEKWAEIENMLKRRADLIPNLVETVKGFAKQEKEVFTTVAQARSQLLNAKGVQETSKAAGGFESAISRLLMISERYPDLKSNQNFLRLQDELTGTENRIAVARTRYNEAVKKHNEAIKKIPGVLLAGSLGMTKKDYFEIVEPKDKEVPKVNF
ncbi:MAG: LemA family protein [Lentisphaeraceae bacterium]|nr:LemA family protein [Lentisphaeraceae bacterium]